MDEIELEQATCLVRRHSDYGMDVWPLFPDEAGLWATEAHKRVFARLWWRQMQTSPSVADIEEMLEVCAIRGLSSYGVNLLQVKVCILHIPRWDDPNEGPLGKVPNWPEEVLRKRLPEVAEAAADFGSNYLGNALREARFLSKAEQIIDLNGNIEARSTSRLILAKKQAKATLQLIQAIEQLQELLPPPVPRKFAPWHDDAKFLAEALSRAAEEAGISIGMSRADSRGVRFVAMVLNRLGIASPAPNAVAHVLRPSVAD